MPELPDVSVYVDAIAARVVGHRLERVTIAKPFLLRSFAPSPQELAGRVVREVRRLGKRIAIGVEGELWLVLHLMIAGRLHWYAAGKARKQRAALATFDFDNGSLTLTEAGATSRAYWEYIQTQAPDEFKDTKVLALHVHGRGSFHSTQQIKTVADLRGMKLRAPKGEGALTLQDLGPEFHAAWVDELLSTQNEEVRTLLALFDDEFFSEGVVAFDENNAEVIVRACAAVRLKLVSRSVLTRMSRSCWSR